MIFHGSKYFTVKRVNSVERRKAQEDVDKNVVIQNVPDKLPSIVKSNDVDNKEKEINNNNNIHKSAGTVVNGHEEGPNNDADDETSENTSSDTTDESTKVNFLVRSKTPDIVPKSFQDKRLETSIA